MNIYFGLLVTLSIVVGTWTFSVNSAFQQKISATIDKLHLSASTDPELIPDFVNHEDEIKVWLERPAERGKPVFEHSTSCAACRAAVGLILAAIRDDVPVDALEKTFAELCTTLKIVPGPVCVGVAKNYVHIINYIVHERPSLSAKDICAYIIQTDCGDVNATLTQWHINLNENNKPPVEVTPLLPKNHPTAKILHLTDIHLDLNYVDDSIANCDSPLCCRDMPTGNEIDPVFARHFGDYRCDFPKDSLASVFKDASTRYDDYSFVLLTGDYVHHAVWATGVAENTRHNKAVAELLQSNFKDGTTIFPVVGNHEPHPCNLFAPSSVWATNSSNGETFDLSWMYADLAGLYANYLPAEAVATFKKAGYYTVTPEPGLRLVVLNTNFCYVLNFWIFYDSVDVEGQLQWFANTMQKAEDAGEQVYVVGHVPPGHYQSWSHWNKEFNRVINRFESIIKGQFYGHTHEDDLKIFFESPAADGKESRPTSSLYIGASATTYTDLNPGYKVYHVDGAETTKDRTWEILNHETFIYNLTEANLNVPSSPRWYQLYSAREAYGLDSLRPTDLYQLVVKMVNDDNLFQSWYSHYNKASDTMEPCRSNSTCRISYLCDVVTTDIKDSSHCDQLKTYLKD